MRWVALLLLMALPVGAADLCIVGGESICCHPLCDLYSPFDPTGFSTDGSALCAIWPGVFTLSSSATDPYVSSGTLTEPYLYLWVNADATYGYLDGHGQVAGDFWVFDFQPEHSGVTWTPGSNGTGEFHAHLCTFEPTLLASLMVFDTTAVESSSWARIKALWSSSEP